MFMKSLANFFFTLCMKSLIILADTLGAYFFSYLIQNKKTISNFFFGLCCLKIHICH